jgi:cytoskeletal protein RodZ
MAKAAKFPSEQELAGARSADEIAEQVEQDTAEVELEKAQKRIAREERRARREIEKQKQAKARWVLPIVLVISVFVSWILSKLSI